MSRFSQQGGRFGSIGERGGDQFGTNLREQFADRSQDRADAIATLSVACADEIGSCNLGFAPESVFAEILAFKAAQREAGTREPLPAEIEGKKEALKECFQSMKEELSALSTEMVPSGNQCIEALKAARRSRGDGKGDRGGARRGKLCADESRPQCADGQKPTFNRDTMSVVCSDGVSAPLCADGSAPTLPEGGFRGGKGGHRGKLCADESRPRCADGQKPTFDRDTMSVICSDGVSTPLCADGSSPQLPEGGVAAGVRDANRNRNSQSARPWSNFGSQFGSNFGGVNTFSGEQPQDIGSFVTQRWQGANSGRVQQGRRNFRG